MRRMIRSGAALLVMSSGCSDQVVGYFDDSLSLSESSSGEPPASTFNPITGSTTSSGADGDGSQSDGDASSTGSGSELGPCTPYINDNFDGPGLDEFLWFNWAELDSAWTVDGQIVFTPPSARHPDNMPADTGLVSTPDHQLPIGLDYAVRMEVVAAPVDENPILLFLMVLDTDVESSVMMKVRPSLEITGNDYLDVEDYNVELNEIIAPRWIGMAFVGDEVHYQVSEDGVDWTTVHVGPMISTVEAPRSLIMVQTYGDVPTPPAVVLDNYSVCKF